MSLNIVCNEGIAFERFQTFWLPSQKKHIMESKVQNSQDISFCVGEGSFLCSEPFFFPWKDLSCWDLLELIKGLNRVCLEPCMNRGGRPGQVPGSSGAVPGSNAADVPRYFESVADVRTSSVSDGTVISSLGL